MDVEGEAAAASASPTVDGKGKAKSESGDGSELVCPEGVDPGVFEALDDETKAGTSRSTPYK